MPNASLTTDDISGLIIPWPLYPLALVLWLIGVPLLVLALVTGRLE